MNKKETILIAEDDVLISESLKQTLEEFGYEVLPIVSSTLDAKIAIEKHRPDLAILDINMNGRAQGLEIAAFIHTEIFIPFIFLTSYAGEGMVERAASFQPEAYIVKPFNAQTIFSTVKLALANTKIKNEKVIQFKSGHVQIRIPLNEVVYLQAEDIYVAVHTIAKKYLVRTGLKTFLLEQNFDELVQTHRSYAVNKRFVNEFNSSNLIVNNVSVPISRSFSAEVKAKVQ